MNTEKIMTTDRSTILDISTTLRDAFDDMEFSEPVTHIYNPLKYAWRSHSAYLERFGSKTPREVLMVGMNPGPWGMAQTGVPFGEIALVRDWMGIEEPVDKPAFEHPKRLVEGFACQRSEVSGSRLWGWAKDRFDAPESFFERFFVWNYCPLSFMEEGGRNRIPEKLPIAERNALFAPCDQALRELVEYLEPELIVGVGAFAEKRIKKSLPNYRGKIGRILHPSPASPKANRGWAEAAEKEFAALGIDF